MTRHEKQQHKQRRQQQKQQEQKDKGWYCKEHDVKYLCDICGYENVHKQKEMKYYFVSG